MDCKLLSKTITCAFFTAFFALNGCSDNSGSPGSVDKAPIDPISLYKFIPAAPSDFVAFESGQVRPLAKSSDGKKLYAVNTPDNRLEIFRITATSLVHQYSIPVGMEPVAVAESANGDIWVVNHLSDSISIIDTSTTPPRVSKTLLVGDEPRDIVFAGAGNNRAFITTAHRGQNSPYSPQLMPDDPGQTTLEGIGRADVWVFDASNTGSSFAGTPITIIKLFTDTPRALTVSADGSTVYAAGFHTGNKTTTITDGAVCIGGATASPCFPGGGLSAPGGLPAPNTNTAGADAPEVGLIVKNNGSQWLDELGRDWSNKVLFNLPDTDVFSIDASANPPVQTNAFSGVGTVLFNMVSNPVSDKIYVSNTDAINEVRFEGTRAISTATTVVGHMHEARITIIDPTAAASNVTPRHLNKHIDYSLVPSPAGVKANSLATPTSMVVSTDGAKLYVAAFGSSKIGVFDTQKLEDDSFTPSSANHIMVTGGGPSGLVLDDSRDRLYAFTRFDNSISIIDTNNNSEIRHYPLPNPEPQNLIAGRPFLYDANFTSSNGEASCSSCHVFADFDSLAWDLGDPEGAVKANPNVPGILGGNTPYHPMKGPMTTQSLRGLTNQGPMHWRGDRTAGDVGGDPMGEAGAFKEFNVAFAGLVGRSGPLSSAEMDSFTNFILQVTYPPNPNRPLDNTLTTRQSAGADFYFNNPTSTAGILSCNDCHVVNPSIGFFGTDGRLSVEGGVQNFKIPHLRNMYQKVGMFGFPKNDSIFIGDDIPTGDQVRGFGFTHDGSIDTLSNFHNATLFNTLFTDRLNLEQFMHAMDSNMVPVIGQQITLNQANLTLATPRIQLMTAEMDTEGLNQVIVKGVIAGVARGWVRLNDGTYQSDDATEVPLTEAQLFQLAQAADQQLTFTAVPKGTAIRMAVDRDNDLILDQNDNCPSTPNNDQADTDADGIGDACPEDCVADFDNDGDVDGIDAATFGADFGATSCSSSTLCEGDFDVDGDVDGIDSATFSADFGRSDCPIH